MGAGEAGAFFCNTPLPPADMHVKHRATEEHSVERTASGQVFSMMRLAIASSSFAVLAIVCTIAYEAGAGQVFIWLACALVVVAILLLGLWFSDLWWAYKHSRPRKPSTDSEDIEPPGDRTT